MREKEYRKVSCSRFASEKAHAVNRQMTVKRECRRQRSSSEEVHDHVCPRESHRLETPATREWASFYGFIRLGKPGTDSDVPVAVKGGSEMESAQGKKGSKQTGSEKNRLRQMKGALLGGCQSIIR
jgi:hypothetical protein